MAMVLVGDCFWLCRGAQSMPGRIEAHYNRKAAQLNGRTQFNEGFEFPAEMDGSRIQCKEAQAGAHGRSLQHKGAVGLPLQMDYGRAELKGDQNDVSHNCVQSKKALELRLQMNHGRMESKDSHDGVAHTQSEEAKQWILGMDCDRNQAEGGEDEVFCSRNEDTETLELLQREFSRTQSTEVLDGTHCGKNQFETMPQMDSSHTRPQDGAHCGRNRFETVQQVDPSQAQPQDGVHGGSNRFETVPQVGSSWARPQDGAHGGRNRFETVPQVDLSQAQPQDGAHRGRNRFETVSQVDRSRAQLQDAMHHSEIRSEMKPTMYYNRTRDGAHCNRPQPEETLDLPAQAGYNRTRSAESLDGLHQMEIDPIINQLDTTLVTVGQSGVKEDVSVYASLLRQCSTAKALSQGKHVHAHMSRTGYDRMTSLGNRLIRMYVKCGALEDATAVLAKMRRRNVVSWTAVIGAYARRGHGEEALLLFERMKMDGIMPNKVTFLNVLAACSHHVLLAEGRLIHDQIIRNGLDSDVIVGTALLSMYGRCSSLGDALRVFRNMPERNAISYNAMIGVYARHGEFKEALSLFRRMQFEGFSPDNITYVSILSACASQGILAEGKLVHALVLESCLEPAIVVRNALINMYGKCGSLKPARAVFDTMPERDVVSWTSIIATYVQLGQGKEALQLFEKMELEGVTPSGVALVSVLDECGCRAVLSEGEKIRSLSTASRLDSNAVTETALVNMYGKCGCLPQARRIFDEMSKRDVVTWNAMIAAYAQQGQSSEALQLLHQMERSGIIPDKFTFSSLLDACANEAAISSGKRLHALVAHRGLDSNLVVLNALVNMYGKCGHFEEAQNTFDKMSERDLISWNTMIATSVQNGHNKEALRRFQQMQQQGVTPDKITFISVLSAAAGTATLVEGEQIRSSIVDMGFDTDVSVSNALLNMYAKCGRLEDAQRIFDGLSERNAVSWNCMIVAHAQHGLGMNVIQLFQQMHAEGVIPTRITFICLLSACNHVGSVEEAYGFLVSMARDYDIAPTIEHYNCMLDILGRAGQLDEGEDLLNNVPVQLTVASWVTLLSACRTNSDAERGKRITEGLSVSHPQNPASYVLLGNTYAAVGECDKAMMVRDGLEKTI